MNYVWFEEAATVFVDQNALETFDSDYSTEDEERYIALGFFTQDF